ncbi:VanZ family protein [bacterium]|nr:VanZ family protein [bacterium]
MKMGISFNRRWSWYFILYLIFCVVIGANAYRNGLPAELSIIPYYDTIAHFFLIGWLGFLAHKAINEHSLAIKNFSIALGPMVIAFLSIMDESCQTLSPHRTFSLLDLAMNLSGILFFYIVNKFLNYRKSLVE